MALVGLSIIISMLADPGAQAAPLSPTLSRANCLYLYKMRAMFLFRFSDTTFDKLYMQGQLHCPLVRHTILSSEGFTQGIIGQDGTGSSKPQTAPAVGTGC